MHPDTRSVFGRYQPSAFFRGLISFSQHCPHNWIGQQIAQLLRALVLAYMRLPADVVVEETRMRCYLRDNASENKFVFMPWRFDGRERGLLAAALPRDGVFVDIGANVGIYTLSAATHLGSRGRILAIEPNPPALARLRFNIAATQSSRSDWPTVDTLQLGVSEASATFELHLHPQNLGASSLAPAGTSTAVDPSPREVVRITCRPLLEVLQEQSVSRIDALKIDIEGAEDRALVPFLADAPEALLPRLLIVENSQHLWKLDLSGALERRGYRKRMRSRLNTVYELADAANRGPHANGA